MITLHPDIHHAGPFGRAIRRLCRTVLTSLLFGLLLLPASIAYAAPVDGTTVSPADQKLLDDARAAAVGGKQADALRLYRKFLESRPDDREALQAAGDILVGQGEYEKASSLYLRLLRSRPDDGQALFRMGMVRSHLGQYYEAQATLHRAIESKALDAEQAGEAQSALDAIYDNWDVLNVMQARKDNPAQERFHTFQINKDPSRAVVSYALRGFVRHSLHRPDEALSDFNTALSMGGMDEGLRTAVLRSKSDIEASEKSEAFWANVHNTVKELEARNDKQGLEEFYTGLLDDEPARVCAAVGRAFVRASRNDYDGAESDLQYAMRSNPDEKARADIEKGLREIAQLRQESDPEAARLKAEALQAGVAAQETTPPAEKAAANAVEKPAQQAAGKGRVKPKRAPAPYVDPYPLFDETDRLLQQHNYGGAEETLARLGRLPLKTEEKGILLFFRAELDWQRGKKDAAYQGYKQASRMVKEKYRRSAILARMAEYFAGQGSESQAAIYAERSAALLPQEPWKLAQVAGIYSSIGMHDRAIAAYDAALALHPEPRTAANALMGLAETYKTLKDDGNYLRYAREYDAVVKADESVFSDEEKGLAAFYEAELQEAAGDPAGAFRSREAATRLLKEKYRLSETYVEMARYQAGQGNPELAGRYAESAAELLPDQIWRIQDAIGIFRDTGNISKAEYYTLQAISLDPAANGALYADLASLHLKQGDRENFLSNNARYIDYLLAEMDKSGKKPSEEELLRLHEARKRQKEVSRTWGFASYHYYSRTNEGNYFYGMTNELSREFRLANGRYGKFYAQYVGTLTSYYSGDYLDRTTMEKNSWVSRQHLNDTAHGVIGIQIHPIPILYDLSFDAEYVFPLHDGKDKDDDFRFRITYGWTEGDEPMPFGNMWDYKKLNLSATYSARDGDVTSSYSFNGGDVTAGSEFRYGKTLVPDFDRNLLVIPFVQARATYWGRKRESDERWQLEAGPSIIIKKWFNEDKYHTPKSSAELQFYYNWGLNGRHENTFGINAAISF